MVILPLDPPPGAVYIDPMCPRLLIPLLSIILCLSGCTSRDALDDIRSRGELVIVTRNSPTTYYLNKEGPAGFEYALGEKLAGELGVELKIATAFDLNSIFLRLERGEADIAAAGLTLTSERSARFPHTAPYDPLQPQVIYKTGRYRPRSPGQLENMSLAVLADSSHAESLRAMAEQGIDLPRWREIDGADSMELLEMVDSEQVQLTVVDSNEFEVQQGLYPRLKVAFDLGPEQQMVWYLSPATDNSRLIEVIDSFFQRLSESGELARLREQHFGHSTGVSRIGSHTFALNMRSRLPEYKSMIQQVAREYQLDWHLLAAIAYQESHWDPRATSPTGVRGMMMLTLPTAGELGVENRLDPRESLRGGARYLKNMRRRLPNDIYEPDRTWMALAAYNIGLGHLEDARVLTERQGGDPHLWQDVAERLPLLQKSAHYQTLRHGFARGQEAATYVQNIRHYYAVLQWQDIPDTLPAPPVDLEEFVPETIRGVGFLAL